MTFEFGADLDPGPTPDTTPFFTDFKVAKKKFIFFSYNSPTGTSSSVKKIKFFAKNFVLKFNFAGIISAAQHIYEKRQGSGSGSVPLTNEYGSGRPKTYGSCGSGSPTQPKKMETGLSHLPTDSRGQLPLFHRVASDQSPRSSPPPPPPVLTTEK